MKTQYMVTVGNIGTVYNGTDRDCAEEYFTSYVKDSNDGYGRAAGEEVVFWIDDEPTIEYLGKANV